MVVGGVGVAGSVRAAQIESFAVSVSIGDGVWPCHCLPGGITKRPGSTIPAIAEAIKHVQGVRAVRNLERHVGDEGV